MTTASSRPTVVEKPTLIKLKDPKPFTGKREELGKFLQDTRLYLAVNDAIYNNDIKKFPLYYPSSKKGTQPPGKKNSWKIKPRSQPQR